MLDMLHTISPFEAFTLLLFLGGVGWVRGGGGLWWGWEARKPWSPTKQKLYSYQINEADKENKIRASVDDWKVCTAVCLSLSSVFPSMRTKLIPFSHINSWQYRINKFYNSSYTQILMSSKEAIRCPDKQNLLAEFVRVRKDLTSFHDFTLHLIPFPLLEHRIHIKFSKISKWV